MVKTTLSILITGILLFSISVFEIWYVDTLFNSFDTEVDSLYDKTENKTANYSDGLALRASWDAKKKVMHIWVPHNDISCIDYWLNEALGYLYTENYEEALSKLEVLSQICYNVPKAYSMDFENVF